MALGQGLGIYREGKEMRKSLAKATARKRVGAE